MISEKNEKTKKYTLTFRIIDVSEIPKTVKRRNGAYNEILNALKNVPYGKALNFTVPKRTTANGIQKYFKNLGYVVETCQNEDGTVNVSIHK